MDQNIVDPAPWIPHRGDGVVRTIFSEQLYHNHYTTDVATCTLFLSPTWSERTTSVERGRLHWTALWSAAEISVGFWTNWTPRQDRVSPASRPAPDCRYALSGTTLSTYFLIRQDIGALNQWHS